MHPGRVASVANWATLYRQPSRLPVVPVGTDPRADWFRCDRYECRLPKASCANRYRLSKQRTREGLAYQAVQYGGCAGCNVGAAHAAGLPTPPFLPAPGPPALDSKGHTSMDDIAITPTNGHPTRAWPERTCAKCKQKFTPLTARERRCTTCADGATTGCPRPVASGTATVASAAAPKRRGQSAAAKKPARGRRGNGAVPIAVQPEVADLAQVVTPPNSGPAWQPKPLSATSTRGVLRESQIATASELLELAGYKVQTVRTPAGEFLRVL